MGASVLDDLGDEIAPWRTSKGTLQFTPKNPLPDWVISKIVTARIAANAAKTLVSKTTVVEASCASLKRKQCS
jgi:uncharacterized protein YdhG (YjbR/CyaY superfamily)